MDSAGTAAGICCGICIVLVIIVIPQCMNTLTPTQYGLKLDWWTEVVSDNHGIAFQSGRYWLLPTQTLIKFPAMVETITFASRENGGILSRTADGLAVKLECSLSYQIMPTNITALYKTLGEFRDASKYMVQVAKGFIMTESTHYNAHQFFANRSSIAPLIEEKLRKIFRDKLFAYLQFFQLQSVLLPRDFEDAIKKTTLTTQQIAIEVALRERYAVEWETKLLQMQQHVSIRTNEAKAQATEDLLAGEAKGQRILLHAKGDAAAILVKAKANANATAIQRNADAQAIVAAKRTEAGTIRLKSLTAYNATKLSYYLAAKSYAAIRQAAGSENAFLDIMRVRALQNVSWKKMSVNLGKDLDPLKFMGLASST